MASALAGPIIICGGTLIMLRAFAFEGKLTAQHPDLLSTFLPSWCYLGRSLTSGHIPNWNPHVMGGIPFVSDPLSGWAYAPAMVLFSALPCSMAMRFFIVLQPILGGLGVYWFLRTEGTSRAAAAVGGSILSLSIAGSALVLALPFSATLTWTALLLAAAARLMRASAWPRRLLWLAVTALMWGQLAATHLSNGLVPGSLALLLYLVAKGASQLRQGHRTVGELAALAGLLVLALPLVNLAYFLPRLAYLPHTTLGEGYVRLQQRLAELRGVPNSGLRVGGVNPTFPFRLTVPGGVYLGGLTLVMAFIGWRDRRLVPLAATFSLYGLLSYVLGLKWVARHAEHLLSRHALGAFYLHETQRFEFGVILAAAILAGVGVEAWRRPGPLWSRGLVILPGLVVWALIAPALHLHRVLGWLPLTTVIVGMLILLAATRRLIALTLIPGVIAIELLAFALAPASVLGLSQKPVSGTVQIGPYLRGVRGGFFPASDYFREGAIARALEADDAGRYLSIAPTVWSPLGYHVRRTRQYWGLMGAQQSMLFGLEEGQGYNSIQLVRYWEFVRAVDPKYIRYNAAGFTRARPIALDLLQVAYLIQPVQDEPAVAGEQPVAQQGRWVLYRLPDAAKRATVVTAWSVVRSSDAALSAILASGFHPADDVVLEADPGLVQGSRTTQSGSADYRSTGPQSAIVHVQAIAPSIVVVRNTYDPHWHARVDGRLARVLSADYLVQGIPVPAGRHTITLSYENPSVGYGLLGTGLSLSALFGLAGFLAFRRRGVAVRPSRKRERWSLLRRRRSPDIGDDATRLG